MKITMQSTTQTFKDDNVLHARVWRGVTEGGVPCDVYVYAVVPDEGYVEDFKKELPYYMKPVREIPGYVPPKDQS